MNEVGAEQASWQFSGRRMLSAAADRQFNDANPIIRINVLEGGDEERELVEREDTLPAPAEAVQKLLEIAFRASLLSEEGSFTRAKLVACPSYPTFRTHRSRARVGPEPDAIRFEPRQTIDEVWLAKNCAAAERADLRIDCEFESGLWKANGFTSLRFDSVAHRSGHAAPISVEIDRPGVVKLYAAADGWHELTVYSAGRYLLSRKYWLDRLIPDQVIRAMEHRVVAALGADHPLLVRLNFPHESLPRPTGLIVRSSVSWHLRRVAESLAASRSGGTVIWSPSYREGIASPGTQVASGSSTPLIDNTLMRWLTSMQWTLRNELTEQEKDGIQTTAARLEGNNTLAKLQDQQSLLAGLASVDGAVLLTDVMSPCSYRVKLSQLELRHSDHLDFLKDRGTRHRSAYGFVQSVPGSFGIVVSSDGDMNAMASLPGGRVDLRPLLSADDSSAPADRES